MSDLDVDVDPSIRPFTFSVPDEDIALLKQKLKLTRFPDELEDCGWDYGAPLADVKRISEFWAEGFDFGKWEKEINGLPNYVTEVEVEGFGEVEVHFLWWRSEVRAAVPLVFVHGWPGSFLEVTKLLPLLAESEKNGGPAFHVVAPSLPNFGFSPAISKPGFALKQYAETCHKLMLKLGYSQYVSQGGDWGAFITRQMGKHYHEHLKASHLNMIPSPPPSWTSPLSFIPFLIKHALNLYTEAEKEGLARTAEYPVSGTGYFQIQATKPQTVGYGLADSPVGLLAWIYEKLRDWTDGYEWSEKEVCGWVSLYWFSRAGPAASARIYYEAMHGVDRIIRGSPGYFPVKLGLSYFPKEIVRLPKAWAHTMGPVVYVKEHEEGGHFAGWEKPELIVEDLKAMFGKGGGAFGVVEGRNGYDEK